MVSAQWAKSRKGTGLKIVLDLTDNPLVHSLQGEEDLGTATPPPTSLLLTIGASAALLVANLYYAQPLIITIGHDLGLKSDWVGSIVSVSQFGYGLGLLMLVPLADMVENRRLVLICGLTTMLGIIGVATARSAAAFLFFASVVGIFSSGAQILIPYLSHLLPPARRGRIVGAIMSGILLSVMLARPFALFVAAAYGWRTVYWLSALATFLMGIGLWRTMPPRKPEGYIPYHETLLSMRSLFRDEREVQRRTLYQALLFGTFTMFWAVIPIVLAERFAFTKTQTGLFALVGAAGVVTAPFAGRLADKGITRLGTGVASLLIACSFLFSIWPVAVLGTLMLGAVAFLIDGSVQMAQVLSRMVVLDVDSDIRGRINAVYMTMVYLSGAVGSVLGVSLYFSEGWPVVALLGSAAALIVFLGVLTETQNRDAQTSSITERV